MNGFDERFADRAREVFDAYAEPVDEPTWERVQATLAKTRTPARDRPPIAGAWARRSRALVALATLLLVGGVGTWAVWQATDEAPEMPPLAVNTDAPPSPPARAVPEAPAPPEAPVPSVDPAMSETRRPQIAAARPSLSGPSLPGPSPSAPPRAGESFFAAVPEVRQRAEAPARPPAPPPSPAEAEQAARTVSPAPLAESAARLPESAAPPPKPADRPSDSANAAEMAARGLAADQEAQAEARETIPGDAVTRDAVSRPAAAPDSGSEESVLGEVALSSHSESEASTLGVDLVLGTNAAFSGRQLAEGAGLTAGLAREWRVRNGLAISTGALAAYTRFQTDPNSSVGDALTSLRADPSRPVNVPDQTTVSTLALEIPLDVIVDVADAGPGRIRAGVGLTSSLYLSQTFEDEGDRYALDAQTDITSEFSFTSDAYRATETASPLSRLDIGRQANVSLGYTLDRGRTPLTLDAYSRLPLGGVTSRDLPISVVGIRLRVGL